MFVSGILQHTSSIRWKSRAIMHSNWLKRNLNLDLDSSLLTSKLNPLYSFTTSWSVVVASHLKAARLHAVRLWGAQSAPSAPFSCRRNHWYSLVVASFPLWFSYPSPCFIGEREENLGKQRTYKTYRLRKATVEFSTKLFYFCHHESLKIHSSSIYWSLTEDTPVLVKDNLRDSNHIGDNRCLCSDSNIFLFSCWCWWVQFWELKKVSP